MSLKCITDIIDKWTNKDELYNFVTEDNINHIVAFVNKIFSKIVIDTAQLLHISKALNHDFFKYYSESLND